MTSFLKKLFSTKPPPPAFHDSVLGMIHFSKDEELWEIAWPLGESRSITLRIAGQGEPDPRLLAHAREVAQSAQEFTSRIRTFLQKEAARFRGDESTVRSLSLESLNLFWPKRPNDGMVYFASFPEDTRVWRCDYIEREPKTLGYDS